MLLAIKFVFPHIAAGPKILLEALPDPSLEIKDALLWKSLDPVIDFSMSTRHKANELKAEAEDAIPLLCGKVLVEFIFKKTLFKKGS